MINIDEMIRDLRRVLKYNSVKGEAVLGAHNGREVNDCLNEALEICREMGFKTKNIGGYAGFAEYGEGEDYVAVLGHLDIVPHGNDWKYDPFKGEIDGEKIYGRGTNDDKGPMIAALHALKSIKDEKIKLGSRIRIIFGTSEETGGPDIENYLKEEKNPKAGFTPDASFPVINAEKGIINFNISKIINSGNAGIREMEGGFASNMVPDKASIKYEIDGVLKNVEVKGLSAHGSTPEKGDNAILKLFKEIKEINTELEEEMSFLITALEDTKGSGMNIALKDDASGNLSSNVGVLKFKDDVMSVTVNLRVPVTFTEEDVKKPLMELFEKQGYAIEFTRFTKPLYYLKDLPLVKTLMEVYKEHTGDHKSEPIAIGGGTYAKSMENIVAFGPGFPGREDVDHIANEYIFKEDFLNWAKIYKDAIIKLSFI